MRGRVDGELRRAVERHYDSLALLYRLFWGEHVHHGYWGGGASGPRAAQAALVALLAERASVGPGDRVLDVGCGYGASGRWLARQLGCDVTGLTLSVRQARLARTRNSRLEAEGGAHVIRADASALPCRPAAFDVVWVIECLEHLADKPGFVRSAARALRPCGRLAVCAWLRGPTTPPEDPVIQEVCRAFLCPSLASEDELARWCEAAGLEPRVREDLTPSVVRTWRILRRRLDRGWARILRPLVGQGIRRFVDNFATIEEAFQIGVMRYGLLVAGRRR